MFFIIGKLIDFYFTTGIWAIGVYFIISLFLLPFDKKKKTIKQITIEFIIDCVLLLFAWPYFAYYYGKKAINLLYCKGEVKRHDEEKRTN